MCRMLAQIAPTTVSSEEFLVRSRFSLLRQSERDPKHRQKDGWGLAWVHASSPQPSWETARSILPVFKEKEKYKTIASRARSQILLAHIRQASNPRKLPHADLIRIENCQPFVYRHLCFMHNGTLNIPDAVAGTLGPYRPYLRGTNDSEVLFWLFLKCWNSVPQTLPPAQRWSRVAVKMVVACRLAWSRLARKKRDHPSFHRGLNWIASDGRSLAAVSFYDKADGRSLCGQDRPYFEMCYNKGSDQAVVASEPPDARDGWKPIPNRHILILGMGGSEATGPVKILAGR